MKYSFSSLLVIILSVLLYSCQTQKNVTYLQDLTTEGVLASQSEQIIKLRTGDKVSVYVNSAATPDQTFRYNTPILNVKTNTGTANSQYQSLYTINEEGYISIPGLSPVKAAGLTRSQLAETIQAQLRNGLLQDAVVSVECYQMYVTVLGEVKIPGRVEIVHDKMTLLEALGAVGDLTIQAQRAQIIVIREENGEKKNYFVDLRSKDVFQSPVYYLQQNDVIYVQPNKYRRGQSTVNDNSLRSISTWLSVASVATSITILITNATRK